MCGGNEHSWLWGGRTFARGLLYAHHCVGVGIAERTGFLGWLDSWGGERRRSKRGKEVLACWVKPGNMASVLQGVIQGHWSLLKVFDQYHDLIACVEELIVC